MKKRGIVSLWLGHVKSEEVLKSITTPAYSEDGDFIPSYFERKFGFERSNEWTNEISFIDEPASSFSANSACVKPFRFRNNKIWLPMF